MSLRLHASSLLCLLTATGAVGCSDEPGPPPCEAGPGEICTVAGVDIAGFKGDGGPATEAALYLPQDATVGPDGLLYLLDWNNHRVRRVDGSGVIDTFAGTGQLGDGPVGPARDADFNHPTNIVFDGAGKMIIAAWHNSRIKVLDLASGMLEDACGTGARSYNGDGGPAEEAVLDLPASVAIDPNGELFIMDQANQVIRKIDSAGEITRVAGQCIVNECMPGDALEACPMSNKMVCNAAANPDACKSPCQPAYGGDDGPALEMRMSQPFGQQADPAGRIAFDADGNLYFADTGNHRVRRIDTDGTVTTVAGTGEPGLAGEGGPATAAQLNRPIDIAIADDGTLYIADTFNSCVRMVKDGNISTVAGVCGQRGFAGEGGPATAALLDRPYGITLAPDGTLYVVDTYNHRVRMVAR
jgi:DNA-binding beta-propeller fold protein YncE